MAKPRGAPTKLTPELHAKIVAFVRAGSYVETAAAASGINKDTFYAWLRRGADQKAGIYRDFSDAVEKALAESEILDVDRIGKSAKGGNWQAAAWRLERRFPDRWGRSDRHKLEHTGKDGGPIESRILTAKEVEAASLAALAAAPAAATEDFD